MESVFTFFYNVTASSLCKMTAFPFLLFFYFFINDLVKTMKPTEIFKISPPLDQFDSEIDDQD